MHRCIELARLGKGNVSPNPMVGAVLVYEDLIIGEGYHKQYGESHAEVNCIRDAELRYNTGRLNLAKNFHTILENCTIYVSLEPCAHFGKTPPCADLIIKKKIPKVVIGCRDPFEMVNGKGIEKLQAAGIDVITAVLEADCIALNKRFFMFHLKLRPYIILKWAQSEDHKISGYEGTAIRISNAFTNRIVHKWRSEEASILVGTTTALLDDPLLTTRLWVGNNPVRLVIDMDLKLPTSLQVFNNASRTIIFNTIKHEQQENNYYYKLSNDLPFLQSLTDALYQLNITSVLVEGGAKLLKTFINSNIWDEARIITNNELSIYNGTNAPVLSKAVLTESRIINSDTIRIFKPAAGNRQ